MRDKNIYDNKMCTNGRRQVYTRSRYQKCNCTYKQLKIILIINKMAIIILLEISWSLWHVLTVEVCYQKFIDRNNSCDF